VEGVRHFRSLSIRYLSLFEGSKLSIRDNLFLAYEWAANTPIVSAAHEFKLSKDVVINFYKKCRDIVAADVDRHVGELLGGAGQVVEIDECQLGRRKHQRGRVPREIWVFGVLIEAPILSGLGWKLFQTANGLCWNWLLEG
jgi:hypothetical protein